MMVTKIYLFLETICKLLMQQVVCVYDIAETILSFAVIESRNPGGAAIQWLSLIVFEQTT